MFSFFLAFLTKAEDITIPGTFENQKFNDTQVFPSASQSGEYIYRNCVFTDSGGMTFRPFRFQQGNTYIKLTIESCSFISIHFQGSDGNQDGAILFIDTNTNSEVTIDNSCIYDCSTERSLTAGGAFYFKGKWPTPNISSTSITKCESPKRVIYLESTSYEEDKPSTFQSDYSNYTYCNESDGSEPGMFLFCDTTSILNYCSFSYNQAVQAVVYFEVANAGKISNSQCTYCNFLQNSVSLEKYPILIHKQTVDFQDCVFACNFLNGQDIFKFNTDGGNANLIRCRVRQGKIEDDKPAEKTCPADYSQ